MRSLLGACVALVLALGQGGCGGPSAPASSNVSYIDPATGMVTNTATVLVRIASLGFDPKFRDGIATYSYLYRSTLGELVLIDGGYSRWITGEAGGIFQFQDSPYGNDLMTAIGLLAPGSGADSIAAAILDHGHPDHMDLVALAARRTQPPLAVWAGSGDQHMVDNTPDTSGAGADRQTCWVNDSFTYPAGELPALAAPTYQVNPVNTSVPAGSPADWVNAGFGISLIPAPSHTPGTLIVYLRDINVAILSGHLRRGSNDCVNNLENSNCHTDCATYASSFGAYPAGAVQLLVHPDTSSPQ